MTASAWTDDRIGRLKTLWLEGQTAEQIARDLANGITRSAVLGKVHRIGLSAGRSGRPPKGSDARPKPVGLSPARSLATRPIDARPVVAAEHGLATVLSVRRCQCRWPFGDPRRLRAPCFWLEFPKKRRRMSSTWTPASVTSAAPFRGRWRPFLAGWRPVGWTGSAAE